MNTRCRHASGREDHKRDGRPLRMHRVHRASKALFDRTVAAGMLALLAPVMVACAAVVAVTSSSGPVVDTSPRLGRGGRQFAMHNFRVPAGRRLGRAFEIFGLNHLPELFDVLRGEMSLVGPRPRPTHALPARSSALRPGITGLWALNPTVELTPDDSAVLEQRYIASWSLALDVRILLRATASVRYRTGN